VVSSSIFFPLWKNGLKYNSRVTSICSRSKNLNLSWRTLSFGANPTEQSFTKRLQIFAPGKQNIKIVSQTAEVLHAKSVRAFLRCKSNYQRSRMFSGQFCNAIGQVNKKTIVSQKLANYITF